MAQARRYRLLSILGQGGFGTVYRARLLGEGGFSKPVALKVLNPELAQVSEIARRLRDEARVLGLVQHRAIVGVDGLVLLDGRWTVVMEYVDGRDLKTILDLGPVPLGPALEIAAEVAGALHAAWHATGPDGAPLRLLHRDIKPANICVTALGEVKVLDFGIARAEFGDREARTQSQAFGTPDYMAPERFMFENGPEADVYAVGVTLYEMLLGQMFGRASPNERVHNELLEGRLQLLRDLLGPAQEDVLGLLSELLAYEPAARPNAREVERRLTRLRHQKEGALLRDWAEAALPPLVAAQEGRIDSATGTMLVEGTETPRDAFPPARPAWHALPPTLPESSTFALGATPPELAQAAPKPERAPSNPTLSPSELDAEVVPVLVQPTAAVPSEPIAVPEEPPAPRPRPEPGALRERGVPIALGLVVVGLIVSGVLLSGQPPAEPPAIAETKEVAPVPVADVATTPSTSEPASPPEAPTTTESTSPTPTPSAPRRAPAPSPAVAPSPETAPETAPQTAPETAPADAPSVLGRWEGSMNGRPLDLVLRGRPDAIAGEVVISFGPSSVSSGVRGRYDEATRTLSLDDVEEAEDAGSYTATLSADGKRLSGAFRARARGDVVSFTAARSGP